IEVNGQRIVMAGVSHNLNAEQWFDHINQINKKYQKKPHNIPENPFFDALEKEYQKCLIYSQVPNEYMIETIDNTSVKLTPREAQCLTLLLQGKIAKVIAYKLNISPRTV